MADFKSWYALNKENLAAKRKKRYDTDPIYRQQVIDRAAEARLQRRLANPPQPLPGASVADACEALGTTEWTLSSWREREYYPEPNRAAGRIWFTQNQVQLLGLIKQFFEQYPRRLAGKHRQELKGVVEVIFHNWSN